MTTPRPFLLVLLGLFTVSTLRAQSPAPGTVDPDFPGSGGVGPDATVRAIVIQPADGKILVAGDFAGVNGVSRPLVARLLPDGSVDATFNNSKLFPTGSANALAIQADGKILVGGLFYRTTDAALITVARLNTNGSLDTAFDSSGTTDAPARAVAVGSSGTVYVGGAFQTFEGFTFSGLVRLLADGSVDATGFNPGTGADGAAVNALARLPDGRLFVGGSFATFDGVTRPGLVRLKTDGSVDTAFAPVNPVIAGAVLALVPVQTGGNTPNGVLAARANGALQRLTGAGTMDPAFTGIGFVQGGNVLALAVDDQGRTLLGGSFTRYGATARRGLARLLPDGTLDATFNPGVGPDAAVRALALGADGGLVLGGDFATVSSVVKPFLARVVTGPPAAGTLGFDATVPVSVSEGAGTLTLQVDRVGGTRGAVSIPVLPTLGGTGVEGVDYTFAGDGTVSFADGAASGTLTLNILDNATPQTDRTFTLALGTPTGGAVLGTPASVTVVILDDDFPPVITSAAVAVGTVGVPFSFPVTATNTPTRFSALGLPDGLTIDPGTGVIAGVPTATGVTAAAVSAGNAAGTGTGVLTVAIAPGLAPTTVALAATTPTASASAALKGVFTLTRTGGDASLPALTVYYKIKGSAVGGVDYQTLTGVATFPTGAATLKVKVKPLPVGNGSDTTVELKLRAGDGYGLGSSVKATVTVTP